MAAIAAGLLVPCLLSQSLDRLPLLRVIELKGRTYHVQGIEVQGIKAESDRLWVTSVDRDTQSGYLHEFALPGGMLVREVKLQDGARYHPGGIAGADGSLWIPIAEYRANSTSIIQRRNKRTLAVEKQFSVDDHIVVYCQSGKRSNIAADTLTELGYTNVYNIRGSVNAWLQAGYPLAGGRR